MCRRVRETLTRCVERHHRSSDNFQTSPVPADLLSAAQNPRFREEKDE